MANRADAVDATVLNVGSMAGKGWKLEGVKLAVTGLNQKQPQFKLSANKLTLPKPFNDLRLANIACDQFAWGPDDVHCKQGKASVKSADWQLPDARFSFHFGNKKKSIHLEDAHLLGSRLVLDASTDSKSWQCQLRAKRISNALIDRLFQVPGSARSAKATQAKPGDLNLVGEFSGRNNSLQKFSINMEVEGLTEQTKDGSVASEKLALLVHLEGYKAMGNSWYWQNKARMTSGALYVDPVYLEAGTQPITLNAQGSWNTLTKKADIQSFTYQHPDVGVLSGNAFVYYREGIKIDKVDLALHSDKLQNLATIYVNPFYAESPLTGISVAGNLDATASFVEQTLMATVLRFINLKVKDEEGRLAIMEGNGIVNWSNDATQTKQSELAWQQLAIKGLPFESARIRLLSQGNRLVLADKVKLPLLNGSLLVDKFSWQGNKQDEPDVSFAGSLENVSLQLLSKAFGWTSLSGNISGKIPGVDYHNKTLTLGGELVIRVFDGLVKVKRLASSGLFTDFPKLESDIEIENLDLDELTQKFEFGNITGRLSGFINKLVLENWHPVTFFAWLGTPDNDDSRHRISQKAVKNIASIGGGAATDLLSRSFLGFFETFGYDKMGVGCYLHNGVCQMMGLAAAGEGYYLIKGGGLPRIDVLGYNPRVNWDVLVERLGRVASPEAVIVK